jgi:hypothetical protein
LNKRMLVLLLGALMAAFFIAGCGDSDDDTTTASISKAEFLKQGNAICKTIEGELDDEFGEFAEEKGIDEDERPTDAQLEEAAEDFVLPQINRQIDELRALGAPEGEETPVNTLLDNAEAEVEKIEDDPGLLAEDSFAQVNKESRALGLMACGEE